MPFRTGFAAVCLVAVLAGGLGAGRADILQGFDKTRKLCTDQTLRVERQAGIPSHLLTAIALAESGRWDAEARESFAWPWTVTAGGEGRFFATKAAAVAAVRKLQAQGTSNIDVGCMQVNLRYHPDAFASLEEAFEPTHNVAYAGRFLVDLKTQTGSWSAAAGAYHSSDPDRGGDYRRRVVALWSDAQRASAAAPPPTALASVSPAPASRDRAPAESLSAPTGTGHRPVAMLAPPPPIDHERTALLNARLRETREAARGLADSAEHRRQDLAAWRETQLREADIGHLPIVRRAEMRLARQRELMALARNDRDDRFADRRQDQLRRWRLGAPDGGGT